MSGAIATVGEYLVNMSTVGSVIRAGLEEADGALDALSGKLLTAVKRAIAVANLVLNTATLLTDWKPSMTPVPASGWSVAYSPEGSIGTDGVVTVRLEGLAKPPSPAVQACLQLVGLVDPTSQTGSRVDLQVVSVTADHVTPVLLKGPASIPVEAGTVDVRNAAAIVLGTGSETLDATKRTAVVDTTPAVIATIQRADVDHLTSWIRSLANGWLESVLSDALESIATAIELTANPATATLSIPVTCWVAAATPPPADPPPAPPGPAEPVEPLAEENCPLSPAYVAEITGYATNSVEYGVFEGAAPRSRRACTP